MNRLCFFISIFCLISCGKPLKQAAKKDDDAADVAGRAQQKFKYPIHSLAGWEQLPVNLDVDNSASAFERDSLKSAVESWNQSIGMEVLAIGDDRPAPSSLMPAAINDYGFTGVWFIRRWCLIGKHYGGSAGVTAWKNSESRKESIVAANILVNRQDYSDADLKHVLLHELGHFLGLLHTTEDWDESSIMFPNLAGGRGISHRDIILAQFIYMHSLDPAMTWFDDNPYQGAPSRTSESHSIPCSE